MTFTADFFDIFVDSSLDMFVLGPGSNVAVSWPTWFSRNSPCTPVLKMPMSLATCFSTNKRFPEPEAAGQLYNDLYIPKPWYLWYYHDIMIYGIVSIRSWKCLQFFCPLHLHHWIIFEHYTVACTDYRPPISTWGSTSILEPFSSSHWQCVFQTVHPSSVQTWHAAWTTVWMRESGAKQCLHDVFPHLVVRHHATWTLKLMVTVQSCLPGFWLGDQNCWGIDGPI